MRHILNQLTTWGLTFATLALLSAPASAAIIDFESASPLNQWGDSTLGDGFSMVHNDTYSSGVYNNQTTIIPTGAHSGSNYALNFNSRIGNIMSSTGTFTVNSLWAHADARLGDTETTVRFAALDALDGNILHTMDVAISATWQQISFTGWTGIDVLTWDSLDPDSSNIGIDDVVYNGSTDPSPVPVPAAIWLFGTALIGLAGFGKPKANVST